jgi:hypothetical protein
MKEKESQLVYRIIEYGIKNEICVKKKLFTDLNLTDVQQNYFDQVLASHRTDLTNPNNIMVLYHTGQSQNKDDWQFRLTPSAMFHYNDYVELKEARINAKSGRNFAIGALIVSLISVAISTVQTYYTIKIPAATEIKKVSPPSDNLGI